MSEKKWYVLRTAGTKEKKVADYLRKEVERSADLQATVDEILVPVKKEIVTKNGKRKEVDRLLYPGYVLIHAELNPDLEYIVRGRIIPGLAGFLSEKKGGLQLGYIAGVLGRFFFSVLSGVVFFGEYAPEGMSPLVYSVTYNGAYIGAEAAVTLIIISIPPITKALKRLREMNQGQGTDSSEEVSE